MAKILPSTAATILLGLVSLPLSQVSTAFAANGDLVHTTYFSNPCQSDIIGCASETSMQFGRNSTTEKSAV
jgi:hypothetical protein